MRNLRISRIVLGGTIVLSCLLLFSGVALAVETGIASDSEFVQATGLSTLDIRLIIARVIQVALGLVGLTVLVCIIYGGFLWMTASGNEERVDKAKITIRNCMIGLVVVLASYSLVLFIMTALGIETGFGGGSQATRVGNPDFPRGAYFLAVTSRNPHANAVNAARNSKIIVIFTDRLNPDTFKLEYDGRPASDLLAEEGGSQCEVPTVHMYAVKEHESDPTQDELVPIDGALSIRANAMTFNAQADCGADLGYVACESEDGAACEPSFTNGKTCCGCLLSPDDFAVYDNRLENGETDNRVTIRVALDSDLAGVSGKTLGENTSWEFTIGNWIDNERPEVVAIMPPDDATVPANIGVQVLFSKPVDPSTLVPFGDESGDDPTVLVYNIAADGTETEVPGVINAIDDGFVFRPTTPCPEGAADCQCFAFSSDFRVELLGEVEVTQDDGSTLMVPGIKDNHCNALDCSEGGSCTSQFSTSDALDLEPPTARISSGAVGEQGKLLLNPVDTNVGRANADRTASVYLSICDKYGVSDADCPGFLDYTSVNLDTFIVGDVPGETVKGLPLDKWPSADDQRNEQCCFPSGASYGKSCATLTSCPVDEGAGKDTSLTVRYSPDLILQAARIYYATAYGGGSENGSCSDGSTHWGIQDLAGNSLVGLDVNNVNKDTRNQDWQFTTSPNVNYKNPYIDKIESASGFPEQCVSILGYNFGDANTVGGVATSLVTIPYDRNLERCDDPLAANGGCSGKVFFQKKVCADSEQCSPLETSIYGWEDTSIVAVVPEAVLFDTADEQDILTLYDVYVEMSWGE